MALPRIRDRSTGEEAEPALAVCLTGIADADERFARGQGREDVRCRSGIGDGIPDRFGCRVGDQFGARVR